MNDTIFIFTFSPVQSFITEARRTADLRVGSQILVRLARAVLEALELEKATIIYPVESPDSIPNKIVAEIEWSKVDQIARNVTENFNKTWVELAKSAKNKIQSMGTTDDVWEKIWDRQTGQWWELFWAAARIEDGYSDAYQKAETAIAAAKRYRQFACAVEVGVKDTLSGNREALHTNGQNAAVYWETVRKKAAPSKLRTGERLDAINTVKRFSDISIEQESRFPSISSITSADFLKAIGDSDAARFALEAYGNLLKTHLGASLFEARKDHPLWKYDGDFLYQTTLTVKRLFLEYGIVLEETIVKELRHGLKNVSHAVGWEPSAYYAVLVLDGDDMGRKISDLLESPNPREGHIGFSQNLASFAVAANPVIETHLGALVYNGGDDLLAILPLSTVFSALREIIGLFQNNLLGTASAGISILHRNEQLGLALKSARLAERRAKQFPGKSAMCVRLIKRSGEIADLLAPVELIGPHQYFVSYFNDQAVPRLAGRFAYDVLSQSKGITHTPPTMRNLHARSMFTAILKNLIGRHHIHTNSSQYNEALEADRIASFCTDLQNKGVPDAVVQTGQWLTFARFIAGRGRE